MILFTFHYLGYQSMSGSPTKYLIFWCSHRPQRADIPGHEILHKGPTWSAHACFSSQVFINSVFLWEYSYDVFHPSCLIGAGYIN